MGGTHLAHEAEEKRRGGRRGGRAFCQKKEAKKRRNTYSSRKGEKRKSVVSRTYSPKVEKRGRERREADPL